jgi:2-haloacid dehalogenase
VAVFDVLGTVVDERLGFRTAVASVDPPAGSPIADAVGFADRWLDRVSGAVSRIASGDLPWRPWDQVISDALTDLDARADERGYGAELRSVGHRLPLWPDSRAGLEAIRGVCQVVALSNAGIGPLMDCSRAGGLTWDAVLSSEMVHSAKPDPRVYRFALDLLGIDPTDVVMVAAHPWDLREAAAHGMRTAYVRRPGEGVAGAEDSFDWTADDLLDLAEALTR